MPHWIDFLEEMKNSQESLTHNDLRICREAALEILKVHTEQNPLLMTKYFGLVNLDELYELKKDSWSPKVIEGFISFVDCSNGSLQKLALLKVLRDQLEVGGLDLWSKKGSQLSLRELLIITGLHDHESLPRNPYPMALTALSIAINQKVQEGCAISTSESACLRLLFTTIFPRQKAFDKDQHIHQFGQLLMDTIEANNTQEKLEFCKNAKFWRGCIR